MSLPTLAVWKFASCDGCQLTLLDCEDELLTIAGQVQIATFLEASSSIMGGPYDVSLVEGSITTAADERRIKEIREQSKVLVTIGACATAGGVQALRNFADVEEFASVVYARPEYIDTLATSTPASAHVKVDYQLQGCPIDRGQLLDTLASHRGYDTELGHVGADGIDHRGLLADEELAGAMEHQAALLLGRLGLDKPHVGPGHCFTMASASVASFLWRFT